MKTIIKFLIRLLLVPCYLIVIILGIVEAFSIVISCFLLAFFYEYLFDIEYTGSPFAGSEILWKKLNKLKQ